MKEARVIIESWRHHYNECGRTARWAIVPRHHADPGSAHLENPIVGFRRFRYVSTLLQATQWVVCNVVWED